MLTNGVGQIAFEVLVLRVDIANEKLEMRRCGSPLKTIFDISSCTGQAFDKAVYF